MGRTLMGTYDIMFTERRSGKQWFCFDENESEWMDGYNDEALVCGSRWHGNDEGGKLGVVSFFFQGGIRNGGLYTCSIK